MDILVPNRSFCYPSCMELTEKSVKEIERIHSSWIQMEEAGENRHLLDFCGDDIEFWPPDSPPAIGRDVIMAQINKGSEKIQSIEISERRIRGSNEIAYLTASYKTTLSSGKNPNGREVLGKHLWILQNRAGTWQISLLAWSRWD
jgi:ketosteroid isomerase-like protein